MEFLSYIILFGGIYCFYSYYRMRIKGDLNNAIVLPKEAKPKDCTNKEEYIKKTSTPILVLGFVLIAESVLDIYANRTGNLQMVNIAAYFVVVAVLVWVFIVLNKNNKIYFKTKKKK